MKLEVKVGIQVCFEMHKPGLDFNWFRSSSTNLKVNSDPGLQPNEERHMPSVRVRKLDTSPKSTSKEFCSLNFVKSIDCTSTGSVYSKVMRAWFKSTLMNETREGATVSGRTMDTCMIELRDWFA